jgi:hypothetical protein
VTAQHDDWADRFDAQGRELVPAAPSPDAVIKEIATSDGPSAATQSLVKSETNASPPVPTNESADLYRPKNFSGLPDWSERPRDEAGRFVAKSSDAGIVASLGLAPEVAAVLSAQPDGMASAVDNLRSSLSRIYGDDAAQVAEWAGELSPAVQAKCAQIILRNPHVRKSELAKRIRATLTLTEAAEIEAWLNSDG